MGLILVTGEAGFIGQATSRGLLAAGLPVRGTCRNPGVATPGGIESVRLDLEHPQTTDPQLFHGVDAVVHLAGHVHVAPLQRLHGQRFHKINTLGTQWLAEHAAQAGVRRFVFVSSIAVHGRAAESDRGVAHRLTETDPPDPVTAYAHSKLTAEQALQDICSASKMEFVILRPPLVFGPGARAGFRTLLAAIRRGLPLPLRGNRAVRSMVCVNNFAELIVEAVRKPAAANQLFLVSDFDVCVSDMVGRLAALLDRPDRRWHCPEPLLTAATQVPVIGAALRRLTRSLLVDSTKVRMALNWAPRMDLDQALVETARWFAAQPA